MILEIILSDMAIDVSNWEVENTSTIECENIWDTGVDDFTNLLDVRSTNMKLRCATCQVNLEESWIDLKGLWDW
jgi:hypothetical protein